MLTHVAFGILVLLCLYLLRKYYKMHKVAQMLLRQNAAMQVDLYAANKRIMRLELTRQEFPD